MDYLKILWSYREIIGFIAACLTIVGVTVRILYLVFIQGLTLVGSIRNFFGTFLYKKVDIYTVHSVDILRAGKEYKRGEIFVPSFEVAEKWKYGRNKPSCCKETKGNFWEIQNISGIDLPILKKNGIKIVDERFIKSYKKNNKIKKKHFKILNKYQSNFSDE